MKLIPEIIANHKALSKLRQDIHAHPELAYEESRTAALVADYLSNCGIDVSEGVGGTGVVGTLVGSRKPSGNGIPSIGLRADMDALPMTESNTFPHASKYAGKMHGCGHDGHTVMLLGAAKYLADTRDFEGRVQFIFQPAEEANTKGSGAKAMIEDGLFDRFPVDRVFGFHNMPGLPVGDIALRAGPMMAAMDLFDVTVTGQGTHGALPHKGVDTTLVCAALITAWQTIVSRNVDPLERCVLSATSLNVGETYNVVPETGVIRGSVRSFSLEVSQLIKERFISLTEQICAAYGATVVIDYRMDYPATINDAGEAMYAFKTASSFMPADRVSQDTLPLMGSEDFAHMLSQVPGAYIWIGNGGATSSGHPCLLHDCRYDFNDDIIPVGATLWVKLVEGINS